MKRILLVLTTLVSLSLNAQQRDSSLFPGSPKIAEADSAKMPDISYGNFCKGIGVAVDTIDIGDARFKIILKDDGTWYYLRDLNLLSDNSIFKNNWVVNVTNPYTGTSLSSLPYRNTIILQDSVSRYTAPYCSKRVTSRFGWRWRRRHQGIDIPLHVGDSIVAAFDGRVRASMTCGGYGKLIIIRHSNGLETYYGHLSERLVEVGQWVHSGDLIGLGGNTGRSTGPHLHFETRYLGFAFDPEWIADFITGKLRRNVFVLKRSYLDVSSRYVPTSLEEEYEINLADEAETERVKKEKERIEAEENAQRWHIVKSGESISKIAIKYHTTVSQIKKLNPKLNPDRISIGQQIRVK